MQEEQHCLVLLVNNCQSAVRVLMNRVHHSQMFWGGGRTQTIKFYMIILKDLRA